MLSTPSTVPLLSTPSTVPLLSTPSTVPLLSTPSTVPLLSTPSTVSLLSTAGSKRYAADVLITDSNIRAFYDLKKVRDRFYAQKEDEEKNSEEEEKDDCDLVQEEIKMVEMEEDVLTDNSEDCGGTFSDLFKIKCFADRYFEDEEGDGFYLIPVRGGQEKVPAQDAEAIANAGLEKYYSHHGKAWSAMFAGAAICDPRLRHYNLSWGVLQEGWQFLKDLFPEDKVVDCIECLERFRAHHGMFGEDEFRTKHFNEMQLLLSNPSKGWKRAQNGMLYISFIQPLLSSCSVKYTLRFARYQYHLLFHCYQHHLLFLCYQHHLLFLCYQHHLLFHCYQLHLLFLCYQLHLLFHCYQLHLLFLCYQLLLLQSKMKLLEL